MNIKGLYRVRDDQREAFLAMLLDAFDDYPKLKLAFPTRDARLAALKATIAFYGNYDFEYGAVFSLDENLHDGVCIVHSDNMTYTEEKHIKAGSYGPDFQEAMGRLTPRQQDQWSGLFEALDKLEAGIDLPYPHLYVDYVGVARAHQGQGRGKQLMTAVCRYASSEGLPIMLFTNTEADITFYQKLGFYITDVVYSETFGFTNTYMIKEA